MLLAVWPLNGDPYVGVLDIASHIVTTLAPGIQGIYSPTGHLLIAQGDGALRAAPFDASRGSVTGGFTTVAEGMLIVQGNRPASLSNDGTLSYVAGTARQQVMRVTRDGHEEPVDPDVDRGLRLDRSLAGRFPSRRRDPEGERAPNSG